jgi:DNA polymerase-3 subunit alpha (Gram-positive type)
MPINPGEDDPFDPTLKVRNPEFGDFVIANHLVPEQYVIYPINSLHPKSELIFRYPGHKKKLLQYINSRAAKMNSGRLGSNHIIPSLRSFIDQYLLSEKEKNNDVFIFKKSVPLKRPEEFYHLLEDVISEHPNANNYPKEHV